MKKPHGKEKVGVVMSEFKKGTLKSSSGEKVTNRKQAVAIAMSEASLSKKDMAHGSSSPNGYTQEEVERSQRDSKNLEEVRSTGRKKS